MRRTDRELTDPAGIRAILDTCGVCHLAMVDRGAPYVVPLHYAYTLESGTLTLYFHCAREGRKLDILRQNAAVCFEMSRADPPRFSPEAPCRTSAAFASLIGFGNVDFVEDAAEKRAALSLLMAQQAGAVVRFTAEQAAAVCVLRLVTSDFSAKARPAAPTGACQSKKAPAPAG